jgi:hypothetical protein
VASGSPISGRVETSNWLRGAHQARDSSISGSSPTVAEKRTFEELSVCITSREVRPAYAPVLDCETLCSAPTSCGRGI